MNTELRDTKENPTVLKKTASELARDSMQLRAESHRLRTLSAELVEKLEKNRAQRTARNPKINKSPEAPNFTADSPQNDDCAA